MYVAMKLVQGEYESLIARDEIYKSRAANVQAFLYDVPLPGNGTSFKGDTGLTITC
jgi:hypothetical protein